MRQLDSGDSGHGRGGKVIFDHFAPVFLGSSSYTETPNKVCSYTL